MHVLYTMNVAWKQNAYTIVDMARFPTLSCVKGVRAAWLRLTMNQGSNELAIGR